MNNGNYYRRCHKCDGVIEASECTKHTKDCLFCDFPLAPFCFFDEKYSPVTSENSLRPALSHEDYNPLQGLSAFWDG